MVMADRCDNDDDDAAAANDADDDVDGVAWW